MNLIVLNISRGALLAILLAAGASFANPAQVSIESGELQGVNDDGIVHFLDIPYAAAPVGELRWRAPQPALSWEGVRSADAMGHACPQPLDKYKADWVNDAINSAGLNEDCLNLNIWAPAERNGLLPVMFYMHGGNMQYGANAMPLYDGTVLAREDVVVVIINYRLGYLGRFAHPALSRLQAEEPLANYGLFDQIAALEWVQRNIAAFGGDPDNVTIFGHSAGGVSVNWLMVTPQSEGLFHKAIAMGSGTLLDRNQHVTEQLPRGSIGLSSEQIGELFAEHFGISGSNDAEVVAALRAIEWPDIIEYLKSKPMPFNPVVDGKVAVDHIARVLERGEQHNVPYMGGANSWEWNQIANIPLIGKWFLGGMLIDGLSDEDLAIFDDQWTRIGLSQRWFAEGLFLTSTRYLGKQMSTVSAPAWLYHTDYQQTAVRGYWLNMAKHGNPNGQGTGALAGKLLPEWPEYTPGTDLTQVFGTEFKPVQGLNKEVLDYLEQRALIRRQKFDQMAYR